MTTIELLKAAKELISVPERWTKGYFARDQFGEACAVSRGFCFCLSGALLYVHRLDEDVLFSNFGIAEKLLNECSAPQHYIDYQDTHTHGEVMVLCDRAIEKAEAVTTPTNQ